MKMLRQVRRRLGRHTVEYGKSMVKSSPGIQDGKTKYPTSSQCPLRLRRTGIVEEGSQLGKRQPGSLRLGAPGPDNVTVVEERENVRFKEEKKKRLRKKQRETAKKIDTAAHLGTDSVDVVRPRECVIGGDIHALTLLHTGWSRRQYLCHLSIILHPCTIDFPWFSNEMAI